MNDTAYYRNVIRIKAIDSPNVRLALAQIAAGMPPTYETVVPGVLSAEEYFDRLQLFKDDPKGMSIKLDAEFYKGTEVMLYPTDWLSKSQQQARYLIEARKYRQAQAMGCDPAEGGDSTTFSVVDRLGVLKLVSHKTPDTSSIANMTIALIREWKLDPTQVLFDRGGGGKQHADYLAKLGYPVRSIGFGESATPDLKRGMTTFKEKVDTKGTRYAYKNKRAEMYWGLRMLLDPQQGSFGIDSHYRELLRQLAAIPLDYDEEGRIELLPKRKKNPDGPNTRKSLEEIIGCSPDEADATVLGVYAMNHPVRSSVVGSL